MRVSFKVLAVLLLALSLLLPGCSRYKAEVREQPAGKLPKTFSLYQPGKTESGQWWRGFGDAQLNSLIDLALSGNLTLAQYWARLEQARAAAIKAGAEIYPSLGGSAGASATHQNVKNDSLLARQGASNSETYSLGLSASYEVDLWGRVNSQRQAARLSAQATRQDYNTAAITVAAGVTERWLNIIYRRMQIARLKEQLSINQTYLELIELRYRNGLVSALDVHQQEQVVEKVRAQLPLAEAQEKLQYHQLALLTGRPPQAIETIAAQSLPQVTPAPPTGLPADLLAARPDIRAAGLRLHSADWQVAQARANRLPALKLSAQAGLSATDLNLLFNNWLLTLAANLTAPILDGGSRKAEVERTKAVARENLAVYKAKVLTAIQEVEDALIKEDRQRLYITALKAQLTAAQSGLDQARERYVKGLNTYLPVLTQLLSVQSLEIELLKARTDLLVYRVDLYRALGGAWPGELTGNKG